MIRLSLGVDDYDNVIGYYKCLFGFPVRNLKLEYSDSRPLTPIVGEVLVQGKWIKGCWTLYGNVISFMHNENFALQEITELEYQRLFDLKIKEEVKQLELFDG